MTAQPIVEHFNVLKDVLCRLVPCAVLSMVHELALRSGPIRLNSRPRFLSGVSAATYAASLPVGSITA